MYHETVEIYSDRTNAVVLRHAGRKYPGALVQGDELYRWMQVADDVCTVAQGRLDDATCARLTELRDQLLGWVDHYKTVLHEHDIHAQFTESEA